MHQFEEFSSRYMLQNKATSINCEFVHRFDQFSSSKGLLQNGVTLNCNFLHRSDEFSSPKAMLQNHIMPVVEVNEWMDLVRSDWRAYVS